MKDKFPQRLKELRKKQGYTLEELCILYNKKFSNGTSINGLQKSLNKSTLSRYETGGQKPMLETLTGLAYVLKVTPDYLMGTSDKPNETNETIRRASSTNSEKEMSERSIDMLLTKLPLYTVPVSAGTGQWIEEGNDFEYIYTSDVPKGTDFCLKVRGDSMSPLYNNEDIVFVRANVIIEGGQIGVFFLNNEGYLKMLQGNKLVSLNEKYKPMQIQEFDSFFCVGRVVGKVQSIS